MTADEFVRTESQIAQAAVVLVAVDAITVRQPSVSQLSPQQLPVVVTAPVSPVQPGQLWLLKANEVPDAPALSEVIEALGARVESFDDNVEAWSTIASHFADDAALQRTEQVELRRENTALRRELHRALSALDDRHPLLGLLPSATLDDLAANREPRRLHWSPDESFPVSELAGLPGNLEDAEREIRHLRKELQAVHRTKVMRWTRLPRRLYARVRRVSVDDSSSN